MDLSDQPQGERELFEARQTLVTLEKLLEGRRYQTLDDAITALGQKVGKANRKQNALADPPGGTRLTV